MKICETSLKGKAASDLRARNVRVQRLGECDAYSRKLRSRQDRLAPGFAAVLFEQLQMQDVRRYELLDQLCLAHNWFYLDSEWIIGWDMLMWHTDAH